MPDCSASSGISADMRDLAASPAPAAREAIDLFSYRIAGEAGRLASAMGGLDGLVFTGGIGEHDAMVRDAVVARLAWLGAQVGAACKKDERRISPPGASPEIWVIPTDEETMIAQHTKETVAKPELSTGGSGGTAHPPQPSLP